MKEKFKEYRGFWYKDTDEDGAIWTISREDDGSGDVWYFMKVSFSLDSAIDKIVQMDVFDSICKTIIAQFGADGFMNFAEYAVNKQSTLKRDNKK